MSKHDLKSCPWCHGMAYVESNGERWRVWHDCDHFYGVSIVTHWHKTRHDAVFAWNNRMLPTKRDFR